MTDCDALILAGGLGTRLASAAADRSKVALEAGGRPFVAHLLDRIEAAGGRRVIFCTGHRAESVEDLFGARYGGLFLEYSREKEPMGTAGAARLALPLVRSSSVLVMNGDSLCTAPLDRFYGEFLAKKRPAAMMLVRVPDSGRFGSVRTGWNGDVRSFSEKDPSRKGGWINAGVYLMRRELLASVPEGRPVSFEREVFPRWIGQGLLGHRVRARFLDIGTVESYNMANDFFRKK